MNATLVLLTLVWVFMEVLACLLKVCQYDSLLILRIDKPADISLRIVQQVCVVKAGIKLCCLCHVLSTTSDRVTSHSDRCVALNVFVTL